jgi:hypothetical protein
MPVEVEVNGGRIFRTDDPDRGLAIAEVMHAADLSEIEEKGKVGPNLRPANMKRKVGAYVRTAPRYHAHRLQGSAREARSGCWLVEQGTDRDQQRHAGNVAEPIVRTASNFRLISILQGTKVI